MPVFNVARGKIAYYASLPAANDAIIACLFQATAQVSDDFISDYGTLAAIKAAQTEATFTNYCVDPKTECLTKRAGWTTHDQLVGGDEILAYDPESHTTRWETPSEVYVNPDYSGKMWELSMRGFSALTTPGHRWPVVQRAWKQEPKADVRVTEELPRGGWYLMRSAPFDGSSEPVYSDEFVRIAAWYFTEGCLIRGGKSITISQSDTHNPHNVDGIRRDIKAIGAEPLIRATTCVRDGCDGKVRARSMCLNHYQSVQRAEKRAGMVHSPGKDRAVGLYVTERVRQYDKLVTWDLFGTDVDRIIECVPGKAKVPTMEFLSSLTPQQARMFVDISVAADGSPEWNRFEQYDSHRMDAFTVAAVMGGLGPTVGATGTTCHLNEAAPYIHLANVRRAEVDYAGAVWCPVVPSGHWVARRDGKVHITGNSRKPLVNVTLAVDNTNNRATADADDLSWTAAGGTTNNTLGRIGFFYDPDTTAAAHDGTIIPLTFYPYATTTDGTTRTVQINALGFWRST